MQNLQRLNIRSNKIKSNEQQKSETMLHLDVNGNTKGLCGTAVAGKESLTDAIISESLQYWEMNYEHQYNGIRQPNHCLNMCV